MNYNNNRKRKQQPQTPPPKRPLKVIKGSIQDIYPFDMPNIQKMSTQLKQYINQLEREYIQRYNILISNREVYTDVIENISTELDARGFCQDNLKGVCQFVKITENAQKEDK